MADVVAEGRQLTGADLFIPHIEGRGDGALLIVRHTVLVAVLRPDSVNGKVLIHKELIGLEHSGGFVLPAQDLVLHGVVQGPARKDDLRSVDRPMGGLLAGHGIPGILPDLLGRGRAHAAVGVIGQGVLLIGKQRSAVQIDFGNELAGNLIEILFVQIDRHRLQLCAEQAMPGVFLGIDGEGRDGILVDDLGGIQHRPVVVPAGQLSVGAGGAHVAQVEIAVIHHAAGGGSGRAVPQAIDLHPVNGDITGGNIQLFRDKFLHLADAADVELRVIEDISGCRERGDRQQAERHAERQKKRERFLHCAGSSFFMWYPLGLCGFAAE